LRSFFARSFFARSFFACVLDFKRYFDAPILDSHFPVFLFLRVPLGHLLRVDETIDGPEVGDTRIDLTFLGTTFDFVGDVFNGTHLYSIFVFVGHLTNS
jgi:hypothetical protein